MWVSDGSGLNGEWMPGTRPHEAGQHDCQNSSAPRLGPRQHDDPADQVGRRFQERVRFTDPVQRKARRDARADAALPKQLQDGEHVVHARAADAE